jgi:hypothetical protein
MHPEKNRAPLVGAGRQITAAEQPNVVHGFVNPYLLSAGRGQYRQPRDVVEAKYLLDLWRLRGILLHVSPPADAHMTQVRAWASMHTRGVFNNMANIWAASGLNRPIVAGDHLWLVIRKRTMGFEAFDDVYDNNGWQSVKQRIRRAREAKRVDQAPWPELIEYWRIEPVVTSGRAPPKEHTYIIPSFKDEHDDQKEVGKLWIGVCIHFGIVQSCAGVDVTARDRYDDLVKSAIYYQTNVKMPMTDQDRALNIERAPRITVHLTPR